MAYDQLDHLPDPWWIGAQICQVIAATMGGKKTKVDDWIPFSRRPVRIVSGDAGKAFFKGMQEAQKMKLGHDLPDGERIG